MAKVFVGCDIESTSSGKPPSAQLIQIGVCMKNGDTFVSDINPGWFRFEEEARKVNGFTDERVRAAPPASYVDEALFKWLSERGATAHSIRIVGFNCGSFDSPFVEYYLPRTFALFSYQSVDLNATIFSISEALGLDFKKIKDAAKQYAANPHPHDAGEDAKEALRCWTYLQQLISTKNT